MAGLLFDIFGGNFLGAVFMTLCLLVCLAFFARQLFRQRGNSPSVHVSTKIEPSIVAVEEPAVSLMNTEQFSEPPNKQKLETFANNQPNEEAITSLCHQGLTSSLIPLNESLSKIFSELVSKDSLKANVTSTFSGGSFSNSTLVRNLSDTKMEILSTFLLHVEIQMEAIPTDLQDPESHTSKLVLKNLAADLKLNCDVERLLADAEIRLLHKEATEAVMESAAVHCDPAMSSLLLTNAKTVIETAVFSTTIDLTKIAGFEDFKGIHDDVPKIVEEEKQEKAVSCQDLLEEVIPTPVPEEQPTETLTDTGGCCVESEPQQELSIDDLLLDNNDPSPDDPSPDDPSPDDPSPDDPSPDDPYQPETLIVKIQPPSV